MNKYNYTCGIDIGTSSIKVVVIGYDNKTKDVNVLSTGVSESRGVKFGYITNIDQVTDSIKRAVGHAERNLDFRIKRAYVSIGGINLSSSFSIGSVITSRADQEITELDVSKAIESSEENLDKTNKKIIHTIPISYRLDGKEINSRPEGMNGVKLEVKTLFINCLKQNIEDLITALGILKIEILDIIASPIASSVVLLTPKQKNAGCAILDIGAETVSLIVYEDNIPISLLVMPIGSLDITKDIALGLKIGLEEAESIKHGSVIGGDFSKKKIDEIIEARLVDIFELVDNHLKKIKRSELLPAGINIIGGGANINKIDEIAKSQLKLPVSLKPYDLSLVNKLKIKDSSWYTAHGLALYSKEEFSDDNIYSTLGNNLKQVKGFFKSILSQLLP